MANFSFTITQSVSFTPTVTPFQRILQSILFTQTVTGRVSPNQITQQLVFASSFYIVGDLATNRYRR